MLAPPSLSRVLYYPVTASVALASIAVTLMWWSGQPVDDLFMNSLVWDKWQLWRALTSTLLHVTFFHLAFNLYWFWIFGALAERAFGHLRCGAIFLLLALGSMLAEFLFLSGGVGLSGVVYGLWGLFWILEKHDARFADAVDQRTSQTFIGWFFLCILLTVTGVMPVANIAHGVGAVMGVLLGFVVCGRPAARWNSIFGLAAILIFVVIGSTAFWPAINLSGTAVDEVEQAGITALDHREYAHAVKVLETAAQMRHAPARVWYNLGVACQRAQRYDEAVRAFKHAAAMPDASLDMQRIGQNLETLPSLTITNR